MSFNIAIDGPAGAGKSTIARRAAQELGYLYVDTGAMYRAIALELLRRGTDPEEETALRAALDEMDVSLRYVNGQQSILLNGEDVGSLIRTEEVSDMASRSSAKAIVREKLLQLQRSIAAENNCIMDGRDIGTRILPDAQLKIYLTASVQTRAGRRWLEEQEKGIVRSKEEVEEDIRARDARDMNRAVAPLKQAADAVYIDSSELSIDQVTERIVALAAERAKAADV